MADKDVSKEVWQMTLKEFEEKVKDKIRKQKTREKIPFTEDNLLNDVIESSIVHKQEVKYALEDGKPVPPEVINEYPELQEYLHKTPTLIEPSEIFIRKPKKSDPTHHSVVMSKFPKKEGYKIGYKPYGEQGKGYYYLKNEITSMKTEDNINYVAELNKETKEEPKLLTQYATPFPTLTKPQMKSDFASNVKVMKEVEGLLAKADKTKAEKKLVNDWISRTVAESNRKAVEMKPKKDAEKKGYVEDTAKEIKGLNKEEEDLEKQIEKLAEKKKQAQAKHETKSELSRLTQEENELEKEIKRIADIKAKAEKANKERLVEDTKTEAKRLAQEESELEKDVKRVADIKAKAEKAEKERLIQDSKAEAARLKSDEREFEEEIDRQRKRQQATQLNIRKATAKELTELMPYEQNAKRQRQFAKRLSQEEEKARREVRTGVYIKAEKKKLASQKSLKKIRKAKMKSGIGGFIFGGLQKGVVTMSKRKPRKKH